MKSHNFIILRRQKFHADIIKKEKWDLAGVAQWIECWPAIQRVAGSIPGQGTYLSCRPGFQYEARERQAHIDVSLPLFLPLFLSLKINK